MLGSEKVPWGALWRLGANEPTTLHTNQPIRLGNVDLPPGSFALYAIPGPERWEILVNASTDQWGIEPLYPPEAEIGRFSVATEALSTPVETLTISAQPQAGPATELVLEWERTRLKIPLRSRSELQREHE